MNLERLKMWEAALVEAEAKGRKFDFSTYLRRVEESCSPCGFTACLGGDLALYKPVRKLGLSLEEGVSVLPGILWNDEDHGGRYAIACFLEICPHHAEDNEWLCLTIYPENGWLAYGKAGNLVTRADGVARIRAKIAEIEAANAA